MIIIIIIIRQLLMRHMSYKNELQVRKNSHVSRIWMIVYRSDVLS